MAAEAYATTRKLHTPQCSKKRPTYQQQQHWALQKFLHTCRSRTRPFGPLGSRSQRSRFGTNSARRS